MTQTIEQNILDFLPHRPPFVMIDSIALDDAENAHSTFKIREENTLVENGLFTESGLIENMAQTAGAATGLKAQFEHKPPSLGYIGAVKNLVVLSLPKAGQVLTTEVIFVRQVMNALMVEGIVRCEGKTLATCELKIFIQS